MVLICKVIKREEINIGQTFLKYSRMKSCFYEGFQCYIFVGWLLCTFTIYIYFLPFLSSQQNRHKVLEILFFLSLKLFASFYVCSINIWCGNLNIFFYLSEHYRILFFFWSFVIWNKQRI